jgi:hypothetical protein
VIRDLMERWKRDVEQRLMRLEHPSRRGARYGLGGAGSNCDCPDVWVLILLPDASGFPTSGTFQLDFTNTNSETVGVTINFNSTAAQLVTLIEAESELVSGDDAIVDVSGGPLNSVGLVIQNVETTGLRVQSIVPATNSLNAGQPYVIPWGQS